MNTIKETRKLIATNSLIILRKETGEYAVYFEDSNGYKYRVSDYTDEYKDILNKIKIMTKNIYKH
jgi:hypothetical protein